MKAKVTSEQFDTQKRAALLPHVRCLYPCQSFSPRAPQINDTGSRWQDVDETPAVS